MGEKYWSAGDLIDGNERERDADVSRIDLNRVIRGIVGLSELEHFNRSE